MKKGAVDDLVLLDTISEDAIMDNFQACFKQDRIYTYIGPVLISVNPFKNIPGLYAPSLLRKYTGRYKFECAPHVYAVAEGAYLAPTARCSRRRLLRLRLLCLVILVVSAELTMKRPLPVALRSRVLTRGSKIAVHFLANAVHEWNSKQHKLFSERFVDFAKPRYSSTSIL